MLSRKVVERQQRLAILGQAGARLLIFCPILGNETIERLLGAGPAFGMVDLVQITLSLLLHRLGQIVQDVRGLVHPSTMQSLTVAAWW